jgi:PAS domain S-box-containing protein
MKKPDILPPDRVRFTTQMVKPIALIVIIIAAVVFAFSFETNTALKKSYQERMILLANTTSVFIDGDSFSRLQPGDEDTPEFLTIRDFLYKTLVSDSTIYSLWTMRLNGTTLEFVVDAEYNISPGTPGIGDIYDYREVYGYENPEIIRAFSGPVADTEFTSDEWGTVLSGFSPIRDSDNNVVGIVGVDVIADSVIGDQNRLTSYFIITGLVAIIVALLGFFSIERRRAWADRQIRESEERFRAVFSLVPNPILITRLSDGEILMNNDAISVISGVDPGEVLGKRTRDIGIWSSESERRSFLDDIAQSGGTGRRELNRAGRDGTVRDILFSSQKIKFQDEEVLLNVGWDITDIRQAEQALRDSEEMFRNPVENSPVGVFLSQDSVFQYVNPRLASMLGYLPDELIGQTIDTIISPEDLEKFEKAGLSSDNSLIFSNGYEFHGKRKDGSIIDLEIFSALMSYKSAPAVYGTILDITRRKKAEEQVVRSEMQYRLIADTMKDVVWILDPVTFTYRYISPSVKDLLGYSDVELVSVLRTFNDTPISDDVTSLREAIRFHVKNFVQNQEKKFFSLEVKMQHADGHFIFLEVNANCYFNPETGEVEILGLSRDITKRKTYEREIEEKNLELQAAYEESQASFEEMSAMEQERIRAYEELQAEQEALRETQKALQKAQSIAHLGNFEWIIADNRIIVSEEFSKIFNISTGDPWPGLIPLYEQIDPQDRDRIQSLLSDLLESGTSFDTTFWVQLGNGKMRAIREQGEIEHDGEDIKSLSLIVQDITRQKIMEKEIREAYIEKETLLREIHHRVKNNMQIISSLLSLQSKNITEPSIQALFRETQNRVQSLSLVHELLYQSDNLNKINYRVYLQKISSYLLSSERNLRSRVTCTVDSEDIDVSIEKAIPCSLVVTELITNSIKYAFPEEKKGEIFIIFRYTADTDEYLLDYRDTGKGLPEGFDITRSPGFGSSLVTGLTRQLSGNLVIHNDGPGIHVIITFPP